MMNKNINRGLGEATGKLHLIYLGHTLSKLKRKLIQGAEITNPRLMLEGLN